HLQRAERIEKTESGISIVFADDMGMTLINTPEHKSILESAAGELVGKGTSVSLIMKGQLTARPSEAPKETGSSLDSAKEEPFVKRFLEVFRGDIAQVKPAKGE